MTPFPLPAPLLDRIIRTALEEDLGDAGDLTTLATVPPDLMARATISTRAPGVAAGITAAEAVFAAVDPALTIERSAEDGDALDQGDPLLELTGRAQSLLTGERPALNLLGHLSGIATATRAMADAVDGTKAKIAGTRKTLPGLRALQKHAIRCGGGLPHRYGLHDAVMIKDNHVIAAGGISAALKAAKESAGHTVLVEVEVDTLDQLDEVLREGADIILLDNMSLEEMREAVARTAGRATLEASGNVTVESVRAIAETGVDIISSGALTHSAPNLDIGMELELDR